MNRTAFLAPLASLALAACASAFQPLDIGVSNDGFSIGAQRFASREALVAAIEAHHPGRVRITVAAGTSDAQVDQARLAVHEAHSEALGVAGFEGP